MSGVLCFVDTETTSLRPDRLAWEVAAIRREEDGRETPWHFYIDDVSLAEADAGALKIGGYYERHPDSPLRRRVRGRLPAPSPTLLSEDIAAEWVLHATHDAVLVGSNPAFDAATLAPMLRRHGLIESWHYAVRDIVPLVAGYLRGKGLEVPEWKSEVLSRRVGIEPDDYARHTAMGDAQWSRAVYDAVMGSAS